MAEVKIVSSKSALSTLKNNQSIGTIKMESSRNYWKKNAKSDIFSLSMTLYEIIEQKIPFEDENDNSIIPNNYKRWRKTTI